MSDNEEYCDTRIIRPGCGNQNTRVDGGDGDLDIEKLPFGFRMCGGAWYKIDTSKQLRLAEVPADTQHLTTTDYQKIVDTFTYSVAGYYYNNDLPGFRHWAKHRLFFYADNDNRDILNFAVAIRASYTHRILVSLGSAFTHEMLKKLDPDHLLPRLCMFPHLLAERIAKLRKGDKLSLAEARELRGNIGLYTTGMAKLDAKTYELLCEADNLLRKNGSNLLNPLNREQHYQKILRLSPTQNPAEKMLAAINNGVIDLTCDVFNAIVEAGFHQILPAIYALLDKCCIQAHDIDLNLDIVRGDESYICNTARICFYKPVESGDETLHEIIACRRMSNAIQTTKVLIELGFTKL